MHGQSAMHAHASGSASWPQGKRHEAAIGATFHACAMHACIPEVCVSLLVIALVGGDVRDDIAAPVDPEDALVRKYTSYFLVWSIKYKVGRRPRYLVVIGERTSRGGALYTLYSLAKEQAGGGVHFILYTLLLTTLCVMLMYHRQGEEHSYYFILYTLDFIPAAEGGASKLRRPPT